MTVAFLLDVDNTLLDNDAAKREIDARILRSFGERVRATFWDMYQRTRSERGVIDYPAALARLHAVMPEVPDELDAIVWELPYDRFVYPASLSVIAAMRGIGRPIVVSDGDTVYQPLKIARAGIGGAVGGRVLIFTHKEEHLREIREAYPAERYVMVDDKATILARVKGEWGDLVVTVHVRQGHYADDRPPRPPDVCVASIADLPAALPSLAR
ncbi:MAG: HAD family hydrolase [Chloroflexota bacterium]|nr:HAD family hydrolase [Chloroflexota bacterium]